VFWMAAPIVTVALATVLGIGHVLIVKRCQTSLDLLLNSTLPVVLRIFFLAFPIVTNVAFDAFSCYEFEDGSQFLVADVAIVCSTPAHERVKAIAVAAIMLYPVGIFLLNGFLLIASRPSIISRSSTTLSRATAFLHREYKPTMYLWELVEMSRRFLLVGCYVIGPYHPGSMMQLALAVLTSLLYLVVQLLSMPYHSFTDNYLAIGCSLLMVVLFLASIFYKFAMLTDLQALQDRMSYEQNEDFILLHKPLVLVLILSILGALILSAVLIAVQAGQHARERVSRERAAKARRLHWSGTDAEVFAPPIADDAYHLFLSHVWTSGQDQMRIIKQRLLELVPDLTVFLDVDDLKEIGDLAQYIQRSHAVLAFCSKGYFQSKNCMIELRSATTEQKTIIALLDPDVKQGGLTSMEVHNQLSEVDDAFRIWKLDAGPSSDAIRTALFSADPIEWNRLADFQDVTLRLIAERVLPADAPRTSQWPRASQRRTSLGIGMPRTYMRGELLSQPVPRLPPPRGGCRKHVYCDPRNRGSEHLIKEASQLLDLPITYTGDASKLHECECMLLYLTAKTWTNGRVANDHLAHVLHRALTLNVRVVLVHEMIGIGQDERQPCEFDRFFSCAEGDTPKSLIQAGLYRTVAVPLKGAAWRPVSMRLLAKALAEPPVGRLSGTFIRRARQDSSGRLQRPAHSEEPQLMRSNSSGILKLLQKSSSGTALTRWRKEGPTSLAFSSNYSQSAKLKVIRDSVRDKVTRSTSDRVSATDGRSDREHGATTARRSTRSGSAEAPPPISRRLQCECRPESPDMQSLRASCPGSFERRDTRAGVPSSWAGHLDRGARGCQSPRNGEDDLPSPTFNLSAGSDQIGEDDLPSPTFNQSASNHQIALQVQHL